MKLLYLHFRINSLFVTSVWIRTLHALCLKILSPYSSSGEKRKSAKMYFSLSFYFLVQLYLRACCTRNLSSAIFTVFSLAQLGVSKKTKTKTFPDAVELGVPPLSILPGRWLNILLDFCVHHKIIKRKNGKER